MTVTETTMRIESIQVVGRHRKELGDIKGLAKSIRERGLLSPLVVTPDGRLLAGGRRLAAVRSLGHQVVEVRIIDTLGDAAEALRIERDENVERLDMKPSEMVSLGLELEALEAPKAEARMIAGTRVEPSDLQVGGSGEPRGETREIVAQALGTSPMTYHRAKTVVKAATDPDRPEAERKIAQQALSDMDSGRTSVTAAYERVKSNSRRQRAAIGSAKDQRRAITRLTELLENIASHTIPLFAEIHPDITREEAAQWVDSLTKSRAELSTFINNLRERTK